MTILEGVSNFFGLLHTKLLYGWNMLSLIVITIAFFGLQIVLIMAYARVFGFVGRIYPRIMYWLRRIGS